MARPTKTKFVKWISVKDALPKDTDYVLVYDSNNGFYNIDRLLNDGTWLGVSGYYTVDVIATHWMPLPEPPDDMVDQEA